MLETEDRKQERLLDELKGKNVAYYQVMLNAWIQSRMEHDKTLITLSSAGIGLLVTVAATFGAQHWIMPWLYGLTLSCFLCCIVISLKVYRLNSLLIECELKGSGKPDLKPYDRAAKVSFIMGAIAFCCIGVAALVIDLRKGDDMSKKQQDNWGRAQKSLDGIQTLKPQLEQPPQASQTPAQPASSGSQTATTTDNSTKK